MKCKIKAGQYEFARWFFSISNKNNKLLMVCVARLVARLILQANGHAAKKLSFLFE